MSIQRIDTNKRMSQAVIHGNTIYVAGQVALDAPGTPVADQTSDILGRIDRLLAEGGSNNTKLLAATIWLASMDHFNEMNGVWDAWLSPGDAPARACVEARLAAPQFTVEIAVIAAID